MRHRAGGQRQGAPLSLEAPAPLPSCLAKPAQVHPAVHCTHARRRRFCRPRNPALLRLLLGNKFRAVTIRKDEAVGIREEYHAFRCALWAAVGGITFSRG